MLEPFVLGRTLEEIADELAMSPDTVRGHVQALIEKLQVHSRFEAVRRLRG